MRFMLLVAATLLCCAIITGPAAAQTRYPLACRGGGNMGVNIAGQVTGGGTEIIITYDRATVTRSIPAGSCSWVDRTMNDREPRSLRLIVRARMNVDFRPRPGDTMGDRAGAFVYPGSGPDEALANSIVRVLKAGGYFQVQAYNPGHGPMDAIDFRETTAR